MFKSNNGIAHLKQKLVDQVRVLVLAARIGWSGAPRAEKNDLG